MGVDYSAIFGLGIKVVNEEIGPISSYEVDEYGEYDECDMDEMFDDITCDENFPDGLEYGTCGSYYWNEDMDYYIFIKDPFENGLEGLPDKIKILTDYLDKVGFTYDKVDILGDILIS